MHVMFEFKRLWLVCKVTRSLFFSLSFPQTQKKTAKSGTSLLDTVCMHIQRLSANRYRKHTLMALHILREAVGGDKHGALSILHTLSLSLSLSGGVGGRKVCFYCLLIPINFIFFPESSNFGILHLLPWCALDHWETMAVKIQPAGFQIYGVWVLGWLTVFKCETFLFIKKIGMHRSWFLIDVVHLFILKAKLT